MPETLSSSSEKPTRREALGKILLTATGVSAALLGAEGLLFFISNNQKPQSTGNIDPISTAPAASQLQVFISVDVYYVGMTNLTGASVENFQLVAPASLSNLVLLVCQEHPVFETMSSMQILLNGVAPQGDPELKAGDNVAFLAAMVGG